MTSTAQADPVRGLRIAVTGAGGFLGWHVRAYLHALRVHRTVAVGRADFGDASRLRQLLVGCDAVLHLAGLNRADDAEIARVNPGLARELVEACDAAGVRPHVVYANSTHDTRDSAYGRSKHQVAEILALWARQAGARLTDVVFPHLFGEGGRPFYNSAIATFCHQLARGEQSSVLHDTELELVHAQQAAETMISAVQMGKTGQVRVAGEKMRVSDALARLTAMAQQYRAKLIPGLTSHIDLALFNTYRSYLFPQSYPVMPDPRMDARGRLFEAVKTLHGGQAFISTTRPGVTRGDHFHRYKIERFLVLQGEAVIRIRRVLHEQVHEFRVSGAQPAYIDMPTLHTHNITNCAEGELITLFWAHEIFDPATPDTYPEPVQV